jgi:flagellar motility protein MotE (MotC chaperone)
VTKIRLLPVVVMAIAALLVLKTLGLVTHGSYVLAGMGVAQAAGVTSEGEAGTTEADQTVTPVGEPTMEDTSPTLTDAAPTLGGAGDAAGTGEDVPATGQAIPGVGEGAVPGGSPAVPVAAAASETYCVDSDASITEGGEVVLKRAPTASSESGDAAEPPPPPVVPEGSFATTMEIDCLPSGDAVPMEIVTGGDVVPLTGAGGASGTEQQLLERLTARRAELEQYESDLALRASIVDAAEKRIAERTATLEALEAQISSLVDQRTEMESGQFAGIVAMYENMRPKDAAAIFNDLDMDVLLRVAKTMNPRKMAPILAEMNAASAQKLTVQMAALADRPPAEMTQADLAALPQIVGQ